MKVGIFSTVRGGSQRFKNSCEQFNGEVELVDLGFPATDENASQVVGVEAIIYTPWKPVTENFYKTLAENGVKYVLTCTAGFDHFDLDLIKKHGMLAANVPVYSPNAISEHAVMMVLGILRSFREQVYKIDGLDYKIPSVLGKEIRKLKVGIIGAGRIGYTTMKCLSGFGPVEMLAYDLYENDQVRAMARYVSLDEMYAEADVIIFHCNLTEENHHMINAESLAKCKDGVYLVNVARGGLFNTRDVLDAVKSGKIGGLAIDVIEEELALKGNKVFEENPIPELAEMLKFDNVIFTSHTAFYTETAFEDMSDVTMANAHEYATTGKCKFELVK